MAKTSWRRDYTQDILGAKDRFDDLQEHIGEPPDGQIPLNDWGIYTSPNLQTGAAVSPRDCDGYPDSPYCGGTPWTTTPVGFEPEWGVDECGAWVQVTPILGFTKLPPVSVGWRRPGECREEEKPPEPPPPPPDIDDPGRPVGPLNFPQSIDPNIDVFVVVGRVYYHESFSSDGVSVFQGVTTVGTPSWYVKTESVSLADVNYPSISLLPSYYPYAPTYDSIPMGAIGDASVLIQSSSSSSSNGGSSSSVIKKNWISVDHKPPQRKFPNFKRYLGRDGKLVGEYFIAGLGVGFADGNVDNNISSFILYGSLREIAKDWEGWVDDFASHTTRKDNGSNTSFTRKAEWRILYISKPDSKKFPPPPNQKDKKDCCMQCCNGGNQQRNRQDQDNAELLRWLKKIDKKLGNLPFKFEIFDSDENKVGIQKRTVTVQTLADAARLALSEIQRTLKSIGIDHFPIYSPSSMIQDESNGLLGDLGDLKNKLFKQKIDSLAEFLIWRARNDNEIFGQWQEVIEIQDSDPNVKGNQPKRVVLPNIAKTLKEIILLLSVLIKSQGFSLDANLKMYIDVANTKVSVAAIEAIIRDIQDYLDYPTNTKTIDVPLGISIPKENDSPDDKEDIERFFKNSIVKAMFDDWTGEGSIHDMLLTLLDAASRTIQKPHT